MFDTIIKTELKYKSCFSNISDQQSYFILEDPKLLDMRAHNNIFIKQRIELDEIKNIITNQLQQRKSKNFDFLKVISIEPISSQDFPDFTEKPEIEIFDYISIDTEYASSLKLKDNIEIVHADSKSLFEAGRYVDIEANKLSMSKEFAERRIDRKIEVYKDENIPLELYVCFYKGEPVGNCEMFLGDQIAKIEDFDILENHQRKGLGTHFLRELLMIANNNGISHAYVVTDHFDSAREMYIKCGFRDQGKITELLFNIPS